MWSTVIFFLVLTIFDESLSGNLTAVPATIDAGITPQLDVVCTFPPAGAEMASVVSLNLSRQSDLLSKAETEIAAITAFHPSTATGVNLPGSTLVSGNINKNGYSTLKVTWPNPTAAEAGLYVCRLSGVDDLGHPVVFSATAKVDIGELDVERLVAEILTMKESLKGFQQLFQEKTTQIKQLQDMIRTLRFWVSPEFKGRRYYFSKDMTTDVDTAQSECQVMGGYLAEVNDGEEWNFLKTSFQTIHVNHTLFKVHALLGVSDRGHEGMWTYLSNDQPTTFLDWYPHQPNNKDESDCLIMYQSHGILAMADDPCAVANTYSYVCEVPSA